MHKEILTRRQLTLLPLLKKFSPEFGLVGGTAIALHIGHRRSEDFDLFTADKLDHAKIRRQITRQHKVERVFHDSESEYTVLIAGVKFSFVHYPFPINFSAKFERTIKLPNLETLAAMKAYTLGRRAKWKDYVDLYFILKQTKGIQVVTKKAKAIFKKEFNEKIFRSQLSYFTDIDYSENLIFMKDHKVSSREIKKDLTAFSLGN